MDENLTSKASHRNFKAGQLASTHSTILSFLVWFLESGLWFLLRFASLSDRRSLKSVIGKVGYLG